MSPSVANEQHSPGAACRTSIDKSAEISGQIEPSRTVVRDWSGVMIASADSEKEEDMNLGKMMLVPVFMLAGLATACGDDCVSACEDGKECADASAEQKAVDCDKQCEEGEKQA